MDRDIETLGTLVTLTPDDDDHDHEGARGRGIRIRIRSRKLILFKLMVYFLILRAYILIFMCTRSQIYIYGSPSLILNRSVKFEISFFLFF